MIKARALVGTFKHSPLLSDKLKEIMNTMNKEAFEAWECAKNDYEDGDFEELVKMTKLSQDVPTRWNSALFMLQSVVKGIDAIRFVLNRKEYEKQQVNILDQNEICKYLFSKYNNNLSFLNKLV